MNECIFCHQLKDEQILFESNHFKVVFDIDPIQKGHLLIISKEHLKSICQLSSQQRYDMINIEIAITKVMEETLPISGVTSVSNDKDLMDADTHFHRHLIPRVQNDGFWDTLSIEKQHWCLENTILKLNQL